MTTILGRWDGVIWRYRASENTSLMQGKVDEGEIKLKELEQRNKELREGNLGVGYVFRVGKFAKS